jgi:hypothetical protein
MHNIQTAYGLLFTAQPNAACCVKPQPQQQYIVVTKQKAVEA